MAHSLTGAPVGATTIIRSISHRQHCTEDGKAKRPRKQRDIGVNPTAHCLIDRVWAFSLRLAKSVPILERFRSKPKAAVLTQQADIYCCTSAKRLVFVRNFWSLRRSSLRLFAQLMFSSAPLMHRREQQEQVLYDRHQFEVAVAAIIRSSTRSSHPTERKQLQRSRSSRVVCWKARPNHAGHLLLVPCLVVAAHHPVPPVPRRYPSALRMCW